ncbi:MAG: hypothetical protein AMJ62_05865 [Myxococcales bacterium SG8_38]|nr:MAG: hypothetical protein AMJ62_05865 [Myxococcales bacterium SG8_38]
MPEVAHRQPRASLVPATHGVFAAHRLPRIVKGAARIEGSSALCGHDSRNGVQGPDASELAVRLIERCKHQTAEVLPVLAHVAKYLQIIFVERILSTVVACFVAAETKDDEVRAAALELTSDVRFVVVEQAVGARTHEPEGIVHDAGAVSLQHDTVYVNGAASRIAELDLVRAVGGIDGVHGIVGAVGPRRDGFPLPVVETHRELTAARLLLIVDVEARGSRADLSSPCRADSRPGAGVRTRLHAAVAVESVSILAPYDLANGPGIGIR